MAKEKSLAVVSQEVRGCNHKPAGILVLSLVTARGKKEYVEAVLNSGDPWRFESVPKFIEGKMPIDIRFTICQKDREKTASMLAREIIKVTSIKHPV